MQEALTGQSEEVKFVFAEAPQHCYNAVIHLPVTRGMVPGNEKFWTDNINGKQGVGFYAITRYVGGQGQPEKTLRAITNRNDFMKIGDPPTYLKVFNFSMSFESSKDDTNYVVIQVDGKKLRVVKPARLIVVPMYYGANAAIYPDTQLFDGDKQPDGT
eukprot:GHVS01101416.1.p1 GENE.GHVS01101416.1~~GHVS01101416.1.p1  ORF type:complete len:158 (+),score=7.80 GHVS01101416.1:306-779(+)